MIFAKPVSTLTSTDLQMLLSEQAVENLRLEFKQAIPSKDEALKKLSSFANTFGGYLIIGAVEDGSNGRITALRGVDSRSGFKQQIIQWCFSGVSPPLTVEVSDPIQSPQDEAKVCYVIYVHESDIAPHFINGRKGMYVRTDEHSQRFEAKLATQNEFVALLNRRQAIIKRREDLVARARERFDSYVMVSYPELGGIGARFELSIIPRFPSRPVTSQADVLEKIKTESINWRRVDFPNLRNEAISQNESGIVLNPGSNFSIIELNIWGLLFYATEVQSEENGSAGIHLYSFLGHLCAFLKHANQLLGSLGMAGPIEIELKFDGVRGVPWLYAQGNALYPGPSSRLDDTFTVSLSASVEGIRERTDGIAMELLKYVLFSVDWASMVDDREKLINLLESAYRFNFWQRPESFAE